VKYLSQDTDTAAFPMIGRLSELQRIKSALRKPEPLLVLGPAGSGKTELIRAAIGDSDHGQQIVHLRYTSNLHRFLIDLAGTLIKTGHRGLAPPAIDPDTWLSQQTSVHLKGLLWTSLEREARTIAIDGIDRASFPTYRFLQRLYFTRGMALLATARDAVSLGALGRLFWDPRAILHLGPLHQADAAHVFSLAADRFRLRDLDLEDFRDKVLGSAEGNPGQIHRDVPDGGKPDVRERQAHQVCAAAD
jgi:energy-coupling factor transporter ATP-binding protein EcfA2